MHHDHNLLSDRVQHQIIAGAGRYIFIAPCSEQLKLAVPDICEDPEFIDRIEIHKRLNEDIALLFDELWH